MPKKSWLFILFSAIFFFLFWTQKLLLSASIYYINNHFKNGQSSL